jgi:hypothetical protein
MKRPEQAAAESKEAFEAMRNACLEWLETRAKHIIDEVSSAPVISKTLPNRDLVQEWLWRAFQAGAGHAHIQSLKGEVERLAAQLERALSNLKLERDYASDQYLKAEMASRDLQEALRIGDNVSHHLGIACTEHSAVWRVQIRDWKAFKARIQSRNQTKHPAP